MFFEGVYGAVDDDFAPRAGGYEYHIIVACDDHLKTTQMAIVVPTHRHLHSSEAHTRGAYQRVVVARLNGGDIFQRDANCFELGAHNEELLGGPHPAGQEHHNESDGQHSHAQQYIGCGPILGCEEVHIEEAPNGRANE